MVLCKIIWCYTEQDRAPLLPFALSASGNRARKEGGICAENAFTKGVAVNKLFTEEREDVSFPKACGVSALPPVLFFFFWMAGIFVSTASDPSNGLKYP